MVNATFVTVVAFLIVFGGATIMWWFNGGFKKYLKYKHDFQKSKQDLAKDLDQAEKQTDKHLEELKDKENKNELRKRINTRYTRSQKHTFI